jgi:hypothetical protein
VGLINAAGPGVVAVVVLLLPVLCAARWRRWSVGALVLYLLSVALLGVWTAKSVMIADSSHDNPPAWPALQWMVAAVLVTGVTVVTLRARRDRRPLRPAA